MSIGGQVKERGARLVRQRYSVDCHIAQIVDLNVSPQPFQAIGLGLERVHLRAMRLQGYGERVRARVRTDIEEALGPRQETTEQALCRHLVP